MEIIVVIAVIASAIVACMIMDLCIVPIVRKRKKDSENNDKFSTHKGEFIPVTSDLLNGKKITSYAEFIEDEGTYDREIIEKMTTWFKMSPKSVIETLTELEKQKDIFDEFIAGMSGESFLFGDALISVEGFTAKQLHEEYPLSEIGAYNYLKYLREDTVNALEDLKNGLPRR